MSRCDCWVDYSVLCASDLLHSCIYSRVRLQCIGTVAIFVLAFLNLSCAEVYMLCGLLFLGQYPCMSFPICRPCNVFSTALYHLHVVCSIVLSRVSSNNISGLVALCYQFSYLFCPVWCVGLPLYVTPWDGLHSSDFDGIIQFAVVLVSVCPELQALYVFI